jgi:RNA polymerase sigma-70 factor (ECF subfamily)
VLRTHRRASAELATPALDGAGPVSGASEGQADPPEETPDEMRAAEGDAASFALLYERYLGSVYRYVAARLARREEAEDVTSEAFHRAWSSRGAYRASGTFRAWLFRIVRRTLADHYRRAQPPARLRQVIAELLQDQHPTPEECVGRREQQQEVWQLLAGLTSEQQEILCLRFVAELSYVDIAQVLGKREDAVKKAAYRALESIRRRQLA